jgi:hypothetical protein
VKLDINSVEVHPQVRHNGHPVDGALVHSGKWMKLWSSIEPGLCKKTPHIWWSLGSWLVFFLKSSLVVSNVWRFSEFFCIFYWICSLNFFSKNFQKFWSPSNESSPKTKFTVHDTCELKLWFNILIGKTLWFHPFEGEEEEERDESSTIMHKWTIARWNYSKFVSLQFWTQCMPT